MFEHNWDSFLYLFGVGGLLFVIWFWLPIKLGDISFRRRADREIMLYVVIGFLLYLGYFVFWQLYAIGGN